MSTDYPARLDRLHRVNALVQVIACVGRRFFRYGTSTSRMEMDERGRLWWVDKFTDQKLYLHCRLPLRRKFSDGGTLRSLVIALKRYVMTGQTLHPLAFGPWPTWVCNGDLWGYGDDMQTVRTAALALGIVESFAEGEDRQ